MVTLKIKRLNEKAILPTRAHPYDAGVDLFASEDAKVFAGNLVKVPTGVAVSIPPGYVGIIRDRSSVSQTGLKITAGIIDAGYTGEVNICFLFVAPGPDVKLIKAGQKIAQLLVVPVALWKVEEVKELEDNGGRGAKGFGSSGT